jgi:hypothetical protein
MKTKCGIWKSMDDRFTRKLLNLKFMMSHEFRYTCDTGEKGKIREECRDEKLSCQV